MKTVVYQSFRTHDVPAWITACMESVSTWAKQWGYDYRFFDDRFFALVPPELFPRASQHKCILADYARLVAARDLLQEGWDRAIWLDADALVFNPSEFKISVESSYAFCREVWLDRTVFGKPQFKLTVNNAVSVFCRNQTIIDFYLDSARAVLLGTEPLAPTSIGTDFLLKLRRAHAFPLLTQVGIFGPEMTYRYLQDDGRFLRPYLDFQTSPVYAANLCLSHHTTTYRFSGAKSGWILDETKLNEFIQRLLADRGATLNRWHSGAYNAPPAEFDRTLSRFIGSKHALKALLSNVKGS